MSATDPPPAGTTPARLRPDRPVLLGGLVAGAPWLLLMAWASWPLAVVGAAYVVGASGFLAAAYAGAPLGRRQEALVWAVPWAAAVALWWWTLRLASGGGASPSGHVLVVVHSVVLATGCYLVWQASAAAVRQLLERRGRR